MLNFNYIGSEDIYNVEFSRISANVVQVLGNLPFSNKGFMLSREGKNDQWDYQEYTTLYREIEGGLQLSNDGSVYVAPVQPPETEPYVPTLEEIKATKLQEVSSACEQAIYAGVNVALPNGMEHFSLTEKDQINLFGKQAQLAAGLEQLEYHQDGHPCRYYTAEEMQQIITAAMFHVSYHTTYCNGLNMWVAGTETKDEADTIYYGADVPEEYQSEVLKDYLAKIAAQQEE